MVVFMIAPPECGSRSRLTRRNCVLPCRSQADKWPASAQERNRRLVESAAVLLAVYNGEWRGGTAATVRYAQKLDRRLIVLNPGDF